MESIDKELIAEPDIGVPASSKRVVRQLQNSLAGCVLLRSNTDAFNVSASNYFAQQSNTTRPTCIVRPETVQQLSQAVAILHQEFMARKADEHDKPKNLGFVSLRSGGHSYSRASASIDGGVLLDLDHFSDVTISNDGCSVRIGTGARWSKVNQVLEAKNIAVPGGRNGAVGVGGFTLGGGISFFSQRCGFACSNVIEYEVVLASGQVVIASATSNRELWRALKGGGSNFGIVTYFTFRAFPCSDIWGGCLFSPSFESSRSIDLFHKFVGRADPTNTGVDYDNYASGPIVCFCFLQRPGMEIISTFITYTKEPPSAFAWPTCWKSSGFKSVWRYWSTVKQRTLASACQDLAIGEKAGLSQNIAGTVIKNDKATIEAAYKFYREACTEVKNTRGKGIRFVFVLQPLLSTWMHKGDPNYLGLDNTLNEPHVLVSFSPVWTDVKHNDFVENLVRKTIEKIEGYARDHGTYHPYKYVNYCAAWQNPFESHGKENLDILRGISKQYDSEGFFQHACPGGFKLPGLERP
ncbi:FAD-binding domain-containing protein [Aaosphaeria arxii CBS 175.79]|uniref:FAD-binding domain-containing protein n=1 Tax=Aaosphaeria arxii CBS 175.79 TaxID=1450172 RepID=A0A6A5XHT4_9PLEO|nr:FAD-binding domain-containing protein [Aaosphaeria arxii CBS 175.79]KAF2012417.1 FAD-binding domain-containing protein [Aaosphaeria arxii CBS 175.79]